jgi:glycosyltransferase involved in cell wall biosynthesis
MKGLSIIVPAFCEEGNIISAVGGVLTAADVAGLRRYEVIIVDDGSTDGTYSAALCTGHTVVRHLTNLGLRAAYETGLAHARYDHVTWVPGDGEIATESLVSIFRAVGTADLVIPYHGTPHKRPWFRRALTWVSTNEINLLLGKRLHYWQGPVVYPTALARSLPRTIPGFFCMAEMLACAMALGPTYVEVPLTHQERTYGVSKAVSWRRIWDAQLVVIGFWWRFRLARTPALAPALEVS